MIFQHQTRKIFGTVEIVHRLCCHFRTVLIPTKIFSIDHLALCLFSYRLYNQKVQTINKLLVTQKHKSFRPFHRNTKAEKIVRLILVLLRPASRFNVFSSCASKFLLVWCSYQSRLMPRMTVKLKSVLQFRSITRSSAAHP